MLKIRNLFFIFLILFFANTKCVWAQSSFISQTTEALQKMKAEAIKEENYTKASEIKKELESRENEDKKIALLKSEIPQKVNAEDYAGAAKAKEVLKNLEETKLKKEQLRKDIASAIASENYEKASKAKKELELLYNHTTNNSIPQNLSNNNRNDLQQSKNETEQLTSFCSERISAGGKNSFYVKGDGTLLGWGDNRAGQICNGTKQDVAIPSQIPRLSDCIAVSIGPEPWHGAIHCIALKKDGTIFGWGNNKKGQLGDGTTISKSYPTLIPNLTDVSAIKCAWGWSLILKKDGTVWAMGENKYGQLGNGSNNDSNTPVKVIDLENVVAICTASRSSYALKSDGTIWAWGFNWKGLLGNGTESNTNKPTQVKGITDVIAISCGGFHCIAVKKDGSVWSFGLNDKGQLGDGTKKDSPKPILVSGISNAVTVAAGERFSIALTKDGTLWSWGENNMGQLGDSSLSWHEAYKIAMSKTGALSNLGGVTDNGGKSVDSQVPVKVASISNVVGIAAGLYHAIAIKNDGTLWSWGSNINGELGIGIPPYYTNVPKKVIIPQ